jgi:hypothetical protein
MTNKRYDEFSFIRCYVLRLDSLYCKQIAVVVIAFYSYEQQLLRTFQIDLQLGIVVESTKKQLQLPTTTTKTVGEVLHQTYETSQQNDFHRRTTVVRIK